MTWHDIAQGITNALAAGRQFSPPARSSINPWAVISFLYNETLGALTPDIVRNELNAAVETVAGQAAVECFRPSAEPCNHAEIGGWLLAMKVAGYDLANPQFHSALALLNTSWRTSTDDARPGNFGSPDAMWVIYQALERTIGLTDTTHITNVLSDCGVANMEPPRDTDAVTSCTWSEDYSHWLVNNQQVDGSWGGYSDRSDSLAAALYIVILGAAENPGRYSCPSSPDDWKHIPGAWPVAFLRLGGPTYTKRDLLAILSTSVESSVSPDASMFLANELIAAKLNIARGLDPGPVAATIADADRLLSGLNGKLPYHVTPASPGGQKMTDAGKALNAFNNLRKPNCVVLKHLSGAGMPGRGATNVPSEDPAGPEMSSQIATAVAPAKTVETDALTASPARVRPYVRKGVTALAVSADGGTLAAGAGNSIRLWAAATGQQRAALQGSLGLLTGLVFGGGVLASVGRDSFVRLWDVASGRELARLAGHEHAIRSVAVSPDGRFLATAGEESRIMLWDLASRRLSRILFGHTDFVNALFFSPDGRLLASGGEDARVLVFNVATGRTLYTLRGHSGPVDAVAFSPDGTVLASGGQDTVIHLWNSATGQQRQTLKGHAAPIRTLAFSTDGRSIASSGEDTLIILWNAATGALDKTLFGSTGIINALAFDSRGIFLASASDARDITLWNVVAGVKTRVITVP
jgi:hypothetical protein